MNPIKKEIVAMKTFFVFLSLLVLSCSLRAEELVRAVSFSDAIENGVLLAGELTDGDTLTVKAVSGEQFQPLIELSDPGISSAVYALKGMIRYEDVESDGFLQLDNHFGARGTFFTKSLAPAGLLGKISGSSDWRPFLLPFYANSDDQDDGKSPLPEKLSLGLHLPGSGTVSIRGVGLYQYAAGEDPLQSTGQWIKSRNATLIAAIGGGLIGLWGAMIGAVSSRGKARRFVLGSANALLLIGLVSLGGGVAAIVAAQPYVVYYPLLFIGIILVVVFGKLRGTLSARYEHLELKRMQSMDV
jgi:hypothetical protein